MPAVLPRAIADHDLKHSLYHPGRLVLASIVTTPQKMDALHFKGWYSFQMLKNIFGNYQCTDTGRQDKKILYSWKITELLGIKFEYFYITILLGKKDKNVTDEIFVNFGYFSNENLDFVRKEIQLLIDNKIKEQYEKLQNNFSDKEKTQYKLSSLHSKKRSAQFIETILTTKKEI